MNADDGLSVDTEQSLLSKIKKITSGFARKKTKEIILNELCVRF